MFQEVPHDVRILTEEIHQTPVGTERSTLGNGFFQRRRQLVRFEILVIFGLFRDLQSADPPEKRRDKEEVGITLGIHNLLREKGGDVLVGGVRIEGKNK